MTDQTSRVYTHGRSCYRFISSRRSLPSLRSRRFLFLAHQQYPLSDAEVRARYGARSGKLFIYQARIVAQSEARAAGRRAASARRAALAAAGRPGDITTSRDVGGADVILPATATAQMICSFCLDIIAVSLISARGDTRAIDARCTMSFSLRRHEFLRRHDDAS